MTDENEHKPDQKRKSLLARYEIPIDHLSYEYVRVCTDIKELERIVKVLRSGEEGYFPDLQKAAEDRLLYLSPNNHHLRIETPALDRSCFNNKDWKNIIDEVETWKKDVSVKEQNLTCGNDDVFEVRFPPIRQLIPTKYVKSAENEVKQKKKVSDYSFWDKYDVDTELLKMDLEEDSKHAKEEKKLKTQNETNRLKILEEEKQTCTETEKEVLSERENLRGKEFYQAKDYLEAEKYYTASLAILPTTKTYNNRASCRLKLGKYSLAVEDAEKTLKLEPNNIKALYRKGIALKHLNRHREALDIMHLILKQDPNVSQAQTMAKQLSEEINSKMRNSNLSPEKFESQKSPESERCFEVNERGLPKTYNASMTNGPSTSKFCYENQNFSKDQRCFEVNEMGLPKTYNASMLNLPSTSKFCYENQNFSKDQRCFEVNERGLPKTYNDPMLNGPSTSKFCHEYQNFPKDQRCFEVNERGLTKTYNAPMSQRSSDHKFTSEKQTSNAMPQYLIQNRSNDMKKGDHAQIVELSDINEMPKNKYSTKLEIIEIDSCQKDSFEDLCQPKKCKVVDKRSQNNKSEN